MLMGWSDLINHYESLRYSLVPLERVLTPFKKVRRNTVRLNAYSSWYKRSFPSANVDQMFSGRNTSSEDIYLNLQFAANATTPAVRFDLYCLHHAVIVCENGQASIRY